MYSYTLPIPIYFQKGPTGCIFSLGREPLWWLCFPSRLYFKNVNNIMMDNSLAVNTATVYSPLYKNVYFLHFPWQFFCSTIFIVPRKFGGVNKLDRYRGCQNTIFCKKNKVYDMPIIHLCDNYDKMWNQQIHFFFVRLCDHFLTFCFR